MSIAILNNRPSWVLPQASIDLDFVNNRHYQQGAGNSISSLITTSRASSCYSDDSSGNWILFNSNIPAITNKGLAIWEARTNSIRNNSMQGAVAGTPGTLPTNWSVNNGVGLTENVIGTGTENGIDYIDIQFTGTSNGGSPHALRTESINQIAASNGQTYSSSYFVKQIGGTTSNVISVDSSFRTYTAGGAEIARYSGTGVFPAATSTALGANRLTQSATIIDATVAFVAQVIELNLTAAAATNITLRIGWPQLELGAFATSPIRTTNAAVTRAADVVTVTKAPTFGNSRTYFSKFTRSGTTTVLGGLVEGSDGTTGNSDTVYVQGASTLVFLTTKLATVIGANLSAGNIALGVSEKVASSVAPNDQAQVLNGGTVSTGSSATIIPGTTITRVDIGDTESGVRQLDGYIERIAVWPSTHLPNPTLVTITT